MLFTRQALDELKKTFMPIKGGAVQGDLLPGITDTHDLGSSSVRYDNIYAKAVIADSLSGEATGDHGDLTGLDDDDHGAVYANYGAAETITGLWDFDRGSNPPFTVGASSTKVSNLDVDKLDGYDSAAFPRKAENATITGTWAFPATGFTIGSDVNIFRGTGNRLDLASGDSLRLVSGSYQISTDINLDRDAAQMIGITAGFSSTNPDFTSGGPLTPGIGWEITYDGNADFRYIFADELHVTAFIADIARALAGAQTVSKSVAIIDQDFVIPAVSGTGDLYVQDLPGFEGFQNFEPGDYVRLRVIDTSGGGLDVFDAWGQVTVWVDQGDGTQKWTYTHREGATAVGETASAGGLVIDYGQGDMGTDPDEGYWQVTTLATDSPYSEIQTWNNKISGGPWTGANHTLRVRMGNLAGIEGAQDPYGIEPEGYGFWASDNAYFMGTMVAGAGSHWLDDTGFNIYEAGSTYLYKYWDGDFDTSPRLVSQDYLGIADPTWVARRIYVGGANYYSAAILTLGANVASPGPGNCMARIDLTGTATTGVISLYPYSEAVKIHVLSGSTIEARLEIGDDLGAGTESLSIEGDVIMAGDLKANASSQDIGAASQKWENVYCVNLNADTIAGSTLSGQEWEYAGDMVIDANTASTTTKVSIVNQASAGLADLDVENDIIVGGEVDGVDIAAHAASAVAHHDVFIGLLDDDDDTVTPSGTGYIKIAGGAGLQSMDATYQVTLAIGEGDMITTTATTVGLDKGTAQYQVPVTGATPFTPAYAALSTFAGSGLAFSAGYFYVGGGALITVGANDVGISVGSAQYQIIVTGGSPYTPAYANMSSFAGDGLDFTAGAYLVDVTDFIDTAYGLAELSNNIRVNLGTGLTLSTGAIILDWSGTPTTIEPDDGAAGGSSSYAARTDHTHAIVCAIPGSIVPDDSANEGDATSFARSNHVHGITTVAPTVNLSVSSTNAEGGGNDFARATHGHAITTSSNPGSAASILASDTNGYLQLERLGINVAPDYLLHIQNGAADQARIAYDAAGYFNISVADGGATTLSTITDDATGNLTLLPAGDIVLDPTGLDVLPGNGYEVNLGALTNKYLTLHAAELWVETLVAQDTIATIGGRILVGATTKYEESLDSADDIGNHPISNPGFETAGGGGADVFANWLEDADGGTIVQDGTIYHGGSYSAKLTGGTDTKVYQTISLGGSYTYFRLKFWARGDGTYQGRVGVYDEDNSDWLIAGMDTGVTVATWTEVTIYFKTVASSTTSLSIHLYCSLYSTYDTWFDDVTIDHLPAISVEHNQMSTGDVAYSEADGKVEFFRILLGPYESDPYIYAVERDLDGSGTNDWYAGDALFNTGTIGDGWVDLYSISGVDSVGAGPSIAFNVRNSTTYNDWEAATVIGNLNGYLGISSDTYGFGCGDTTDASTNYLRATTAGVILYGVEMKIYDSSGNESFFISSADSSVWGTDTAVDQGDIIIGDPGNTSYVKWDKSGGWLQFKNSSGDTTLYIGATSGTLYAASGKWTVNETGMRGYSGSNEAYFFSSADGQTWGALGTIGEGDIIFGDPGRTSYVFWDASGGGMYFRKSDNTNQIIMHPTDGYLSAGGGAVTLDEDGLTIETTGSINYWNTAYSFATSGTFLGGLMGWDGGAMWFMRLGNDGAVTTADYMVDVYASVSTVYDARVLLRAGSGSYNSWIDIKASHPDTSSTIELFGDVVDIVGVGYIHGGADASVFRVYGASDDGLRFTVLPRDSDLTAYLYGYDEDHGGTPAWGDVHIGYSTTAQGLTVIGADGNVLISATAYDGPVLSIARQGGYPSIMAITNDWLMLDGNLTNDGNVGINYYSDGDVIIGWGGDGTSYVGYGTTTPGVDLAGTYDYTKGSARLLHIKGSGSSRLVVEGATSGGLDVIDSGTTSNSRWMGFRTDGGISKFSSINDDGSTNVANIIAMAHTNGEVNIGGVSFGWKFRIDANTSSLVAKIFNEGNATGRYGIGVQCGQDDPTGTNLHYFLYDGDGTYHGALGIVNSTVEIVQASDMKRKTNIRPAHYNKDEFMGIKVRDFDWLKGGKSSTGLIAQELQEIYPECVDEIELEGEGDLVIFPMKLIPKLISAVQALQLEVDQIREAATLM